MLELPILMEIQKRLWAMGWVEFLILAVLIFQVIQNARRNHLLRTINRTLELHPEIQFERRLAAAEKRVAR